MLRNRPTFTYNGLTIILSNPSRHDRTELLSGAAGYFLNKECLNPDTNIFCCDVRLVDDPSPLYKDTKVILLLGAPAFSKWTNSLLSLNEGRGAPYIINGIICIPSFSAQDAMDLRDFEGMYNEELQESEDEDFISDEEKDGDVFESKGKGKTKRKNYRFWLKQDVKKALRILNNNGQIPKLYHEEPTYVVAPDVDYIVNKLDSTSDAYLLFDCETDFISYYIRCFAFSFSTDPLTIITVPLLTTDYSPFYGKDQFKIFRALTLAIQRNTLVAWNGDQFDFLVLAMLYKIPVKRVYDPMIAAQRIYPTIEKSLGHWVSLATYEPYHKNEGAHGYNNYEQAHQLWTYCGKDVFTMWLCFQYQMDLMSKDTGLKASVEQANNAIIPYECASYLGMHFDDNKRQALIKEADSLMEAYMRVMRALTGPDVAPLISNQKCAKYFHEQLEYPHISKTKAGKASLAKDNLLKLGLKHDNPVIKFLIKYREVQKESGILNFKVWIPTKTV